MKGYFSHLIRQTGLSLGQEQSPSGFQSSANNGLFARSTAYDLPEPLEVEEVIEISAPTDAAVSANVDPDGMINPHSTKSPGTTTTHTQLSSTAKQTLSFHATPNIGQPDFAKLENDATQSSSSESLERKPTPHNRVVQEKEAGLEVAIPTVTVSQPKNKPDGSNEAKSPNARADFAYAESKEKNPTPALIEQHVYISQLPDAYQTALKDWLLGSGDADNNRPINKENLKKTIKQKQHSDVTLKADHKLARTLKEFHTTNESQGGDLHLSIGNINVTVEETKPVKQQPQQSTDRPACKMYAGSSRLSRHYVKVRW